MRRRTFLGLCGAGLVTLWQHPTSVFAQGAAIKVGLTGTIFPGLSNAMLATAAKPFRSLLEQATGVSGSVVQGGTPKELGNKLKKDEVQLGVFQGIEYAWAKQTNDKLEPIVICVNQQRTLRALLIVRSSFTGSKPADLKNKTIMLPAETREHCKVFMQHHSAKEPKTFFKEIQSAADVEEALDEVVDGSVTAAVVDGLAWASYKKGKPGCAKKLRVLESSEPFPSSVVACQSGKFGAGQLQRFRAGLIDSKNSARGKKMLEFLRLTGFESVPDDYEKLTDAIARAYPAPKS
jgi:ABC-type phosphate/phosphonate transport system substrate-binding protein